MQRATTAMIAGVMTVSGGVALADDQVEQTAEPAAQAPRYPRDVMSRPLTYPQGVVALGVDTATMATRFVDPAAIRGMVGYGITERLEWNFGAYAFPTSDVGGGSVDAGLGYAFVRGAMDGKLELVARVQGGYSMAAGGPNPFAVGVHAQYNITPKVGVLTPGGQLTFAVDGDARPVAFGLPVAVGVQATTALYVQLDTKVASFGLANSSHAFIGADTTPVMVTATYNAVPAVDVIAGIAVDVTPPSADPAMDVTVGDTVQVFVGARYYLGKL